MDNKRFRAYLLMWWRQAFGFDRLGRHLGGLGLQWGAAVRGDRSGGGGD